MTKTASFSLTASTKYGATDYASDVVRKPGRLHSFRRSNYLVVAVNFFALTSGVMVVGVLQPILPKLLDQIYEFNHSPAGSTNATHTGILIQTSSDGVAASNETYPNKSFLIGSLLGFAPLIEVFFAPLAVYAIYKCGFKLPMLGGCLLNILGCIALAYSDTLLLLYAARILQALSVIFSTITGLALVAIRFKDDYERSHAMATSLHGLAVGAIVAYPVGTAIYHAYGITITFLILASLSLIDVTLRFLVVIHDDDYAEMKEKNTPFFAILADPKIVLIVLYITYSWIVMFLLGATTPERMFSVLGAETWQIGIVLCVSSLVQIIISGVAGKWAPQIGCWNVAFVAILVASIGFFAYPFCTDIYCTIGPESAIRSSWGTVTASLGPMLGTLVQSSHGGAYIRVYALFMSFNLFGCFVGSMVGGVMMEFVAFDTLYWATGVLSVLVGGAGFIISRFMTSQMSPRSGYVQVDD